MKSSKKFLALLLALMMCVGVLAGCGNSTPAPAESSAPAESAEPASDNSDTPLVVGYSPFSSKFSPFFAETAYDQDVASMTAISLLTSDRTGAIVYNGIEGETINYNGTDYTYYGPADLVVTENADGTVYYDFTLRDDLVFSDGEPVTIDDVIFSMYVLCDPTYDGASTLYAQPIEGMEEYRSGMDTRQNLILAAGPDAYAENEFYTEDQYNTFWAAFNAAGEKFAQEIIDYVVALGYAEEGNVAAAASAWGYELAEDATAADFFAAIVDNYGYDLSDDGINAETAGTSISAFIEAELGDAADEYKAGVQTGESAANISGIQKTGDYSMRVVTTKVDATAIYQLGVTIAPMHYYGDVSLYDYDNNSFGFTKGDLSSVRAKTTQPMGAGPYKFVKFENGVVNFEANDLYFQGAPKTKYINFLETQEADKLNGVVTGTIDITDPSFSKDTVAAVESANGGTLNGDVITVNTVDNLGYGYIGMCSKVMNVGGEPDSEASKNLRKAFGTIFSVYRDVAIDSYYGERASVINYPISNTSWAAPQPTDDGYKVAFSVDVDGNDIYTSDMTAEQKYEAAKQAALGYFEAAGYTVEDGKLTAAPEGAALEYELWIPGDGVGDHPSFMVCTLASDALKSIGMNLIINDLTNSSDLWIALDAQTVAMWAAAWGATVDPDMYQIYYADVANGGANAGGSNYMYAIADEELDQLILDARASTDQTYRKAMYKACLDIVIDWAVEIPVYQRQNAIIFSTERVNMDTVTPDITTFYGWMAEVQNIELN
ncbi:MAG: ABC transporter substrate-binding protein [Candidatus Limivicinus sp.]|nr:ABC transporter substrate-binding protein [Clostridiales bacterium]MDY6131772.1 ABC transporter substrate-binding protein [Candidatus Limivicinus sp.]